MKEKPTKNKLPATISLDQGLSPIPVPITIQQLNSESSLDEFIDADSHLLTAQIALLMQTWPRLQSLSELTSLSDQLIKVIQARRELALQPAKKAEAGDKEISITPVK
jgi:hypothetical protein